MRSESKPLFGMKRDALLRDAALLCVNFLLVLLVCRMYLFPRYGVDSFAFVYYQRELIGASLRNYRIVAGLICALATDIGLNFVTDQLICTWSLIAAIALSSFALTKRIFSALEEKSAASLLMVNSCVLIGLLNVFFVEWFHFVGATLTTAVALLAMVVAVLIITDSQKWYAVLLSLLLLMIADNTYQVFFELYLIFTIPCFILQEKFKFNRRLFCRTILVLTIAFVSALSTYALNLLLYGGVESGAGYRAVSLSPSVIWENLIFLARFQPGFLKDALGFLPNGLLLAVVAGFLLLLVLGGVLHRKLGWKAWLYLVVVLLGCYACAFAPHMVTSVRAITARTLFAVFAFTGMLGVLAWACCGRRIAKFVLLALAGGLLLINAYRIPQFGKDQIITNALDRQISISIADSIHAYEEETGNHVRYLAVVRDENCSVKYEGISSGAFHESYMRLFATEVQSAMAVNFYAGTDLIQGAMDEQVYNACFAGKDWDHFIPSEQLVFVGDTLYMAVY